MAEGLAIKAASIGRVPQSQITQRLMTDITSMDIGVCVEDDDASAKVRSCRIELIWKVLEWNCDNLRIR